MDKGLFFGANDACPDIAKTLALQVKCGYPGNKTS